jgi:hypothetical protein
MRLFHRTTQVLTLVAFSAAANRLAAQQQVTQTVRIEVIGLNHATATAMTAPVRQRATSASVASGNLSLTTSEANQKITASLDRALPSGMTLSMAVAAPNGAETAGRTTLRADTASDVVTGLPTGDTKSMPVQITASGGEAAIVVTYTIVSGP